MATSKNDKQSYILLSHYISEYYAKYSASPLVNKYKEKWAMQSLIDDFGLEDVQSAITYYFKLSKDGHPLSWFYNNFAAIHTSRLNAEKDIKVRSDARKKTLELRAEYLNGVS